MRSFTRVRLGCHAVSRLEIYLPLNGFKTSSSLSNYSLTMSSWLCAYYTVHYRPLNRWTIVVIENLWNKFWAHNALIPLEPEMTGWSYILVTYCENVQSWVTCGTARSNWLNLHAFLPQRAFCLWSSPYFNTTTFHLHGKVMNTILKPSSQVKVMFKSLFLSSEK